MGSEIWALVGVVVGALIAGVLQILAGVLQRRHDRRAGVVQRKHDRRADMAAKRYDTYMHVLQDAARIKLAADDLFALLARPHDSDDEMAKRLRAFREIQDECQTKYSMRWVLSSDQVRDGLLELTLATPGINCEHTDGSWNAELASQRLDRLLQAVTSLTMAVRQDLQVDELLGSGVSP